MPGLLLWSVVLPYPYPFIVFAVGHCSGNEQGQTVPHASLLQNVNKSILLMRL